MALTVPISTQEAEAIALVVSDAVALYSKIGRVLDHNSDLAIDWAAGSTPSYILEDADGNIKGLNFTRQQVANAIGSLDWIRKLLGNQSMTGSQGDHLGNLNLVSGPLG